MSDDTPDLQAEHDALKAAHQKLKRRAQRNERAQFARGLLQGIMSMLKPGDVVFDCGANVGAVTGPLAETGATVHAFEPDPFAFGQLSQRVQGMENVVLHNVAVGVTAGSVRLMRAANFEDNPLGGSVKSTVIAGGRNIDERDDATIEVAMIALPDMIRSVAAQAGRIAFLKMDIEGAELELLEHMQAHGLFEFVGLTVAETHENKFRDLRPRFAALREAVAAQYPVTRVNLDWI
ncbi:FkbM family methyltransferase [Roseicyclus mahoneyensis]|uniref:FkbM family methyltransferase n=1 Tax=Roseicyclus mahoneyensis TaxID=164332 RepID=A0A316GHE9_9RHOB|nr:FkbM family methyltransferase [Roseicyclus mahoneyensis]PWK60486.1 FkbM family methyltransferase [Roseicyclus mahoneyensis]